MTDKLNRKTLEVSIDVLEGWINHNMHVRGFDASNVLAAARAHLATLPAPPKTKTIDVWVIEWAYKNGDDEWLPQRSIFREEAMLLSWLKSNRLADKSHFYYGQSYQSRQKVPDED